MNGAARYEIEHVSRYCYTAPVRQCLMRLCLEPCEDRRQRRLHFEIETRPPACLNREKDCHGNTRHVLDVHRTHRVFEITARSTVESIPAPGSRAPGRRRLESDPLPCRILRRMGLHAPEPADPALPRARRVRRATRHRARERPSRQSAATLGHPPPPLALHSGKHLGGISRRSPPGNRPGGLPGLRPRHDRHRAFLGHSRPLRLGLPARDGRFRRAGAGQRHPRLGRMPAAGAGLDRFRPHQPDPRRQRIRTHRGRARLPDVSPTHGVIQGGGDSRLEVEVRVHACPNGAGAGSAPGGPDRTGGTISVNAGKTDGPQLRSRRPPRPGEPRA